MVLIYGTTYLVVSVFSKAWPNVWQGVGRFFNNRDLPDAKSHMICSTTEHQQEDL